jgi:hypothetical protein
MKRLLACLLLVFSLTVLSAGAKAQASAQDEYATTVGYVSQFYPLWFTHYQSALGSINRMGGPNRVTPLFHYVVAVNVDTLYVSAFLDVSRNPVIVQVPATPANYSVFMVDAYCDVLSTTMPANTPGTYALYGPGFDPHSLPMTVTPVALPLNYVTLAFRVDTWTKGVDTTAAGNAFRKGLSTMPLCAYEGETCPPRTPPGGPAQILPEILFSVPFKTTADNLIKVDPIAFLRQLQRAVASVRTPPMSPPVKALSDHFNALFASSTGARPEFARGARDAHSLIIDTYLKHTDANNWINFTNIGDWGPNVVQRSSITEFLQYGNNFKAAAYFHAFKDGNGSPLDGSDPNGYELTFSVQEIPDAQRFWSVTAYTPEAIELVPNSANVYHVASYTPGLVTNADGSITIHMATKLPPDVPAANWLPIPSGRFNVMLRVYGPTPGGNVADGTYVPPPIVKVH